MSFLTMFWSFTFSENTFSPEEKLWKFTVGGNEFPLGAYRETVRMRSGDGWRYVGTMKLYNIGMIDGPGPPLN